MKNTENQPKITIVVPVYNVEEYLEEALESITGQTYKNLEIICVDDGSTDGSLKILSRFAAQDNRITLLTQKNAGGGAARNAGIDAASGEYIAFLDSDDVFSEKLIERAYQAAEFEDADIVAYNYSKFYEDGTKKEFKGFFPDMMGDFEGYVFNYKQCPDTIMSVINPTPWNKLYKLSFIRENGLRFEEISSTNDITFAAVSVAAAQKITCIDNSLVRYRVGHVGTTTSTKTKNLGNVVTAVQSALDQVKRFTYYDEIKNAALRFAIDNYVFAFKNYVPDLSAPNAKEYYDHIHAFFNSEECEGVTADNLHNADLYSWFLAIKKNDHQKMVGLYEREIVVSLTTYPARIGGIHKVLDSIYNQTKKPSAVTLWLAKEQFPGKNKDLPAELLSLVKKGLLEVFWEDDDLKPHKKYFGAMQKFPEALIVTIDDDLIYNPKMIERLFVSYLCYPNAVSAVRAHLMTADGDRLLPYKYWLMEVDTCILTPTMHYLATGGAGTLYPPHLLNDVLFDKEGIKKCLFADDLWMKAVELISDVPVVVACKREGLRYLPGSQEQALWHDNIEGDKNDEQLALIFEWLDKKFGEGVIRKKLFDEPVGENLLSAKSVCEHYYSLKQRAEEKKNTALKKEKFESRLFEKEEKDSGGIKAKIKKFVPSTYGKIDSALNKITKKQTEASGQYKRLMKQMATVRKDVEQNSLDMEEMQYELRRLSDTVNGLKQVIDEK